MSVCKAPLRFNSTVEQTRVVEQSILMWKCLTFSSFNFGYDEQKVELGINVCLYVSALVHCAPGWVKCLYTF